MIPKPSITLSRQRFLLPLAAMIATTVLAHAEDKPETQPSPGVAALTSADTPLKKGMKISIFGDSLTMQGGYIEVIKKALAASPATKDLKVNINKHGLNGGRVPTMLEGKTPWGKLGGTMQEMVDKDQPDVLVIFLGVNDVWQGKGTPQDEFRDGLKKMVDMGKAVKARVLLVTPLCVEEKPDGTNKLDKKLDEYSQIIRDLAKETGSGLVDMRAAAIAYLKVHNVKDDQGKFKKNKILTYDGVHLIKAGNELVADQLSRAIVAALKAK